MRITKLSVLLCFALFLYSCQKDIEREPQYHESQKTAVGKEHGHLVQTKTFSSEVAQKWVAMELRLLRVAANPYGMNGNRYFGYLGTALYEAVVPGMPAYQSLAGQLNGMPQMPDTEPGKAYHWPASANAALGSLHKKFFTQATVEQKAAMDSLEAALASQYSAEVDAATYERSVAFGREVAQRIFSWADADGWNNNAPLMLSGIPGSWTNTAPNPTTVVAPNWGKNRLFVAGSLDGTDSPPPPPYSTSPTSAYYAMAKEVYDVSQALTPEQRATALYFRDNPGFQAGTHYISIFNQVMESENLMLDQYAVAQAKTGISIAESQIGAWKQKYTLLVDRPIRYIRNVLGHTTWQPVLGTPGHPDFPSGHSQTGGAFAAAMINMFGNDYNITLHTYDNLGMAPRSYSSFTDMIDDIGWSRVYAGIHYTYSTIEGAKQGMRIANNILSKLKFRKE